MTKKSVPVGQSIRKAEGFLKKGAYADAALLFQSVMTAYPKNTKAVVGLAKSLENLSNVPSMSVAPEMIDQVLYALQSKSFEKSNQMIAQLMHNCPSMAVVYILSGMNLTAQGYHQEAISNHLLAIGLQPENADAYVHLGKAYIELGDSAKALGAFGAAATLAPENPDALYNLANSKLANDDKDGAIKLYEQVIQLVPSYLPAKKALEDILKTKS